MYKTYKTIILNSTKDLLCSPIDCDRKYLIILSVSLIYIFTPQLEPIDWDLNTVGFWSDIPHTYKNQNFVYPPWGLILMLPYRFIRAEGARFFSVLVVGWLAARQKWSLLKFFSIVMSPFFLLTIIKSNIDIFVFVLPILLWDAAAGTRWQDVGRGIALSILLVKPQGAVFIWCHLLWIVRKKWIELIRPMMLVALLTIPVSLIGSPPLIIQWVHNITHPSELNQLYWLCNNVSLTAKFTLAKVFLILLMVSLFLLLLARLKKIIWTTNHTIASLFLVSMFLSPYTSHQSISSALAFIPSWGAVILSYAELILGTQYPKFFRVFPLWVLFIAVSSLVLFAPQKKQNRG